MPSIDHLKNALVEVRAYRAETICGYCREIADTVADSLATTIETDALVNEMVRTKHPLTEHLPAVRDSLHETRELARAQLQPSAPARPDIRGLLDFGLRSAVKSTRDSLRPRDLLPF